MPEDLNPESDGTVNEGAARVNATAEAIERAADGALPLTIRMMPQAHIDLAWQWPREDTIEMIRNTFAGHDPHVEPEAFVPFCPVHHVTKDYPPALLLHGDQDTDVPYQQSVMMAEALARAGVEHELITIPGGGHGFDPATALGVDFGGLSRAVSLSNHGSDSPLAADAFSRALSFLLTHLT